MQLSDRGCALSSHAHLHDYVINVMLVSGPRAPCSCAIGSGVRMAIAMLLQ